MKKIVLSLATAAALALTGIAHAGSDPGSWYVAPRINGVWVDDGRKAEDDIGFGAALGKAISPKWNVELGADSSGHRRAGVDDRLRINTIDLNALRVFKREDRINPYLIAGIGQIDTNAPSNDKDIYGKAGLGLMADIAKNTSKGTNLQLRGEMHMRKVFGDPDLTDYVASLGLLYSWGGSIAAPAAAAIAAIAPAVVKPVDGDDDRDGVPNSRDKCPNTPAGAKVDSDGCECGDVVLRGVTFVTDSSEITPQGQLVLDSLVAGLQRRAGTKLEIRGHTDSVGSDAYNLALSQRRADSVKAYLVSKGLNAADLSTIGLGEMQHIATNDTAEGREQNRRVTLQALSVICEARTSEDLVLRGVTFKTNSAVITPTSKLVLDSAVAYLKARPNAAAEVRGHTDSVGNDEANMRLSKARAEAVRDYLIAGGIDAGRLTANGYGETEHIAPNDTPAGREQNRRVTLRIAP
ncbi:MAG: OmpA family protein [Gammaproteobacteria bacterium]|jgi:OOP family OmpA-OmpF porin